MGPNDVAPFQRTGVGAATVCAERWPNSSMCSSNAFGERHHSWTDQPIALAGFQDSSPDTRWTLRHTVEGSLEVKWNSTLETIKSADTSVGFSLDFVFSLMAHGLR